MAVSERLLKNIPGVNRAGRKSHLVVLHSLLTTVICASPVVCANESITE